MDEPRTVQEQHGFGSLVQDVLLVLFGQDVLAYEHMQVRIHVLEYQVDVLAIFRLDDLVQADDVGVLQLHQEHDLAVGSLGVGRIIKGIEVLLEGFYFLGFAVGHLVDMPIGAAADLLDDLVLGQHVGLHFLRHFYYSKCNGVACKL